MKSTTARRNWSAMQVAWVMALSISLAFLALVYFVPSLRYSVVNLVKKPDPTEAERKKVAVRKPEPTEQQVKEIARRVEKKKKEQLAKEIRKLEQIREDMEALEQERVRAAEPEKPDIFRALLEAIALKSSQVAETSGKPPIPEHSTLIETASRIRQAGEGLTRFTQPEDPHLPAAIKSLLMQTAALQERLATLSRKHESDRLKHVQRAQTVARELDDLLRRAAREWPAPVDWSDEPPPGPEVGPDLQELYAVASNDLAFATNLAPFVVAELEALSAPPALNEGELEGMNPADLYEQAIQLDEALQDTFANVRAAELAEIQGQPLAQALGNTMMYPSQSPDLSQSLQAGTNTGNRAGFQAYQGALEQAHQAVQAMRLGAEAMLGKAREYARAGEAGETTQANQLRSAIQQSTTLGSGNAKGQVINLVPMMGAAYQLSGSAPGSDPSDPRRVNQGGPGTVMDPNASSATARSLQLDETEITAQLLPGRKLNRASKRQGWMYIDTWYVIGPFQRQDEYNSALDFKTRYPPETHVDLDATYPGKVSSASRRPAELRWRFYQSNTLRITPPDETDGAVYYAYTEVFSEDEEEVMIAVASDDAAKVWVNDLVVWQDTGLSPWRLDEGFRRILFRKGYNRILVRIESAPGVCAYSILLCPVDLSTAQTP